MTLEDMGILRPDVPTSWYDPGRFWSGDSLPLLDGWAYRTEVEVARPDGLRGAPASTRRPLGRSRNVPPVEVTLRCGRAQ